MQFQIDRVALVPRVGSECITTHAALTPLRELLTLAPQRLVVSDLCNSKPKLESLVWVPERKTPSLKFLLSRCLLPPVSVDLQEPIDIRS